MDELSHTETKIIPAATPRFSRLRRVLRISGLTCVAVFGLLFASVPADAQTAPVSTTSWSQKIPKAVITNFTESMNFAGRMYVIPDTTDTSTLKSLRDLIASGTLGQYKYDRRIINIGVSDEPFWVIIPLSSISNQEQWLFTSGGRMEGRQGNLSLFEIFDLQTETQILSSNRGAAINTSVPEKFYLHIPAKQERILAFHIRGTSGTLTTFTPEIYNATLSSPNKAMLPWLGIWLSLMVFAFMLGLLRSSGNASFIFIGLIGLCTFGQELLITPFVQQNILNSATFIPGLTVLSYLLLFAAFFKSYYDDEVDERPTALLAGLGGIFFIAGVSGILLSYSLEMPALLLTHIPKILTCLLVGCLSLRRALQADMLYYSLLAVFSLTQGASALMTILLAGNTLGQSDLIVYSIPYLFTLASICVSFLFFLTPILANTIAQRAPRATLKNIQKTDTVEAREDLREAREKSEHRRLMQVIEQERKTMADLQIKTALQTEEMRKAKEDADEANRAKSAFLAVVSHEIRTPMTGIMGMLRLLQDTTLTKEQSEYATTIKDSGDALLALLNDILDFEKIESGKMELENISFDLRRMLRGIHTLMKGHADFKNIDLTLEIAPETPTWVMGDPTRLRQVLLNLINNAIKFTSKGTVYIRVQDLTDKSNEGASLHQIYFAVQDAGIGISLEAQKRLFMPFAQANSSVSRKYGGTGLGLAICKRLIEAMGGNISISSKENEGSTFFFTLKMQDGTAQSDDSATDAVPVANAALPSTQSGELFFHHRLKLLVVDDNMINLKVVRGFIDKIGIECSTAGSGNEALDLLEHEIFSAVLLDLQLPDMSGIEITELIRKHRNPNVVAIPVIAFTGNTGDEDIETCRVAGMNDFAPKPISFEKLVDILQKADGQREFLWPLESPEDNSHLSPLSRHVQQMEKEEKEFGSYDPGPIDLDEDDDSFAIAVKKFEEQEKVQAPNVQGSLAEFGLDEAILSSLVNGLGRAQTEEILVSFYEKADELIATIGKTYLSGDTAALYARAHELKGMAANFGFAHLSSLCLTIEKAAREGTLEIAREATEKLGESYSITRTHLTDWLSQK